MEVIQLSFTLIRVIIDHFSLFIFYSFLMKHMVGGQKNRNKGHSTPNLLVDYFADLEVTLVLCDDQKVVESTTIHYLLSNYVGVAFKKC